MPRRSALAGFIATEISCARQAAYEWVKQEIEAIVDKRRVASVADDISNLALTFIHLVIDHELIVRLLGGRRPAAKGAASFGAGTWGSTSEGAYKVDIPLAYQHAFKILGKLWGRGFGSPTTEEDFGLPQRARDTVSQLSAANANAYWVDFWERVALAAEHFRTRASSSVPDFEALATETDEVKLTPIISQQEAQEAARAEATAVATAVATSIASAGQKRLASGNPTAASVASPAPAPASTAGQSGKSTAKQRKANARAAAHQAGTAAAAPAPAGAPASAATTFATVVASPAPAPAPAAPAPAPAVQQSRVTAAAAPAPSPGHREQSAAQTAPTPSWAAGSITRFSDKDSKLGAVECFNFECRRLGLGQAMPCAIQSLTGACRGPPGCRTCVQQAQRSPPTPTPAGLVAKIKGAADANTASRII